MGGEVSSGFVSKGGARVGFGGRDVPSEDWPPSDNTFFRGAWVSSFWGDEGLDTLVAGMSSMGVRLLDLVSGGR